MPVSLQDDLHRELNALGEQNSLRTPHALQADTAPINFCSNDYLGFGASTQALQTTATTTTTRDQLSGQSSRLVSGNTATHRHAESELAKFANAQDARIFSSGYAANLGTLSAICTEGDVIYSDAHNHASIIDGCRLSKAHVEIYRHNNPGNLAQRLQSTRSTFRRALVVTDAVFSMDGDLAPLKELRTLCDTHNAALMVDEAHSIGVLGPNGSGLCAQVGVQADIRMLGLGKSFGLWGGAIVGSSHLCSMLEQKARSYIYSTATPPILPTHILRTLEQIKTANPQRAHVLERAGHIAQTLKSQGWNVLHHGTPILSVILGDNATTMEMSQALWNKGIFVQGIRPPTVPKGTSRLRIVPTASHTDDEIRALTSAFAACRKALVQ